MCLFVTLTILFHFQLLMIGSEGLTFPLFILIFFLLIECAIKYNLKKLSYLAFWTSLLILTRLQFYYFYAIFVLLFMWYIWKRVKIKLLAKGIAILLISILLTYLADKSYHYFKHGFFSASPAAGALLVVQPIFLFDGTQIDNYFKDTNKKIYIKRILDQINQKQLNKEVSHLTTFKPSYYQYAYEEYNRNYIQMHDLIIQLLADGKPFAIENMAVDITKTLVLNDFKKNLFFSYGNWSYLLVVFLFLYFS